MRVVPVTCGETLAFDPGTCDRPSPLAEIVKQCRRHSMPVPVGATGRTM